MLTALVRLFASLDQRNVQLPVRSFLTRQVRADEQTYKAHRLLSLKLRGELGLLDIFRGWSNKEEDSLKGLKDRFEIRNQGRVATSDHREVSVLSGEPFKHGA